MSVLVVTTIEYRYLESRQLRITLNTGSEITAEACHESWEQWGGIHEELCFTQSIVETHNDWLHGGELPFSGGE